MKTLIVSLVVTLLSSFAFAAPTVYGQWAMPGYSGGGIDIKLHIVFAPNQTTAIAECTVAGQSVVAQATAPATYTATTISVTQAVHETQNVNGVDCTASLDVGSVDYQVSADNQQLQLASNGQAITLAREK